MLWLTIDMWMKYRTQVNPSTQLSLESSLEVRGKLCTPMWCDGHQHPMKMDYLLNIHMG